MSGPQLDIDSIEARSARIAAANVFSLEWADIADARQDVPALCREVRQLRQALDKIRTLCSKAGATPLSVGVVGLVHLRPILAAAAAAAQQPKCEHDRSGPHAIHGFGPIAQVLAGVDDRCPGPVTSTPEAATGGDGEGVPGLPLPGARSAHLEQRLPRLLRLAAQHHADAEPSGCPCRATASNGAAAMRPPLWLDVQVGEQSGRSMQATVSLSTCRNCGRTKVASDPCGFEHLAALVEFGRDLERLGYEVVGGTATPADQPERCSTCGDTMDTQGCSKSPGDNRPRAEAGFHTVDGGPATEQRAQGQ